MNETNQSEKSSGKFLVFGILSVLVLAGVLALIFRQNSDSKKASTDLANVDTMNEVSNETSPSVNSKEKAMQSKKMYNTPPEMTIDQTKKYVAVIKTSKGDLKVDLLTDKTPVTVNNFVFLAKEKFYDGVKFHRIIEDFMVQSGDPISADDSKKSLWGTGGPGYRFEDEAFDGEYVTGTLAMANSGPDTNGSQFFIMTQDTPLPKNYVIFGKLADEGSLEVLRAIAQTPVTRSISGELSSPTQNVVISTIEIIED